MKFYITTPLYYVNGNPHIGHSYTNIACDALARFKRLQGHEVLFTTGTDEHGQKIKEAADREGMQPQDFVDKVVPRFKELWKKLNISYDDFIRTTEKRHEDVVKSLMGLYYRNGDLYEGDYSGWYCTPCESFWTEAQLADGRCPDCKRAVEFIKEKNLFFRLSKYQGWLIEYIKSHDEFILPLIRRNEILSFLKNPLNDLCISRPKNRLPWGIPIPFSDDHVTYVWFDALINYVSVCGYGYDYSKFRKFWPADVHMIGKDILRPHAVYWPCMLHAAGIEPPHTIFAHGWWKIGEDKMSKSRGNIIDPVYMVDKYGVDAYRFFLLREVPFGMDGSFSEKALINRINSDLANDLGNLLHRTLSMIEKYFSGIVPERRPVETSCELSSSLIAACDRLGEDIAASMANIDFSQALQSIWGLINQANKFIEQKAPWRLNKEGREDELKDMMYDLYAVLRACAVAVSPFLPETGSNMMQRLGVGGDNVGFKDIAWKSGYSGIKINKGKPLFPRVELTEETL